MAEYKYRALGWKDDDIASLNVVDGTAADNQVELQITKQGAGGTIDGPAIIGKDGITINKAADPEKIEISGSGLLQKDTRNTGIRRAYTVNENGTNQEMMSIEVDVSPYNVYSLARRDGNNSVHGLVPDSPTDTVLLNKKYVDDNYVKIPSPAPTKWSVLVYDPIAKKYSVYPMEVLPQKLTIPFRDNKGNFKVGNLTADDDGQYCANKKYVDDADKDLRLKLSNLEQALNGYILDTTKEAYADLDSAVLKNSVAVGDSVYPIADKTRALVTRIEGKTTKMVQLLDKSTFPATSTPTAGVTVTKTDDGGLHVLGTSASSGGRNSWGITVKIEKGHKYLSLLKGNNKITTPYVTLKSDTSQHVSFVADIATSTIEGECYYGFNFVVGDYDETIYPQLFDLTAMNREDITTVEQFKAEFPDFYPYENGNIYPAKISGVKFTGKNLFDINQFEDYKQNDTSGIKVINDKLLITGYPVNLINNNHYFSNLIRSLKPNTQYALSVNISNYISDSSGSICFIRKNGRDIKVFTFYRNGYSSDVFSLTQEDIDTFDYVRIYGNNNTKPPLIMTNLQIEENSAPTAYEPYIEPVSVTLPETYDLHGIGDYKDYLEITKNEGNELYTLKKVQSVGVYEYTGNEAWTVGIDNLTSVFRYYCTDIKIQKSLGDKGICNKYATLTGTEDKEGVLFGESNALIYLFLNKTNFPDINSVKSYLSAQYAGNNPVVIYYRLSSPVETVIATNLTYEQVTAIRHNGGLIEVEDNTNKGYARPTVTNTIVYRLTAANTVEG